jgi:hypothetical protein
LFFPPLLLPPESEQHFAATRKANGKELVQAMYDSFVASRAGTDGLDYSAWLATFGAGLKLSNDIDATYVATVANYLRDRRAEADSSSDPGGTQVPGGRTEVVGPDAAPRDGTYLVVMGTVLLLGLAAVGAMVVYRKRSAAARALRLGLGGEDDELEMMRVAAPSDDESENGGLLG